MRVCVRVCVRACVCVVTCKKRPYIIPQSSSGSQYLTRAVPEAPNLPSLKILEVTQTHSHLVHVHVGRVHVHCVHEGE